MSDSHRPESNYGIQNFGSQVSGPQAAGPGAVAAYSVGDADQVAVDRVENRSAATGTRPEAAPDDPDPATHAQQNHARGYGTVYAVTDGDMHIRPEK
ncbi:hypothetical protein [Nocardia sp. BMG111209]|uniref:hypothetical protein n=1 Tax=Nocardia sp. BMG111209 TaxID=1160137 RepID=UPI00038290B2|nr:hypothetical protein [Nocardia sp. BMG111209]